MCIRDSHWHGVGDSDDDIAAVITAKDRRGELWQTGAVKLFSDGVIDTGTAWLHLSLIHI